MNEKVAAVSRTNRVVAGTAIPHKLAPRSMVIDSDRPGRGRGRSVRDR